MDSEGDIYVASAGNGAIDVFNPGREYLTTIANANEPCGLAVNGKGELFVSQQATGEVVRYKPNAYPFSGPLSYEAPVIVDASGNAKGISVDPHDDRLYVAEGDHVAVYEPGGGFEANLGEGSLTAATGIAAYTYVYRVAKNFKGEVFEENSSRYLFVADPAGGEPDTVKILTGSVLFNAPSSTTFGPMKLRRELTGLPGGESFGFGPAGAYLAVDPGNGDTDGKCASVAEQACTAGHLLVYDQSHDMIDEFDASGEFLDQIASPSFADAEPTAMAVDRSGGPNDGTIYVTAGAGPAAKLLAFGPLAAPSRVALGTPLSHVLATAGAVATDSRGNVYAAAGAEIHVYDPAGDELTKFADPHTPIEDLGVDSSGNVYVLEDQAQVTYYTPSAYPPASDTVFVRHGSPVASFTDFPGEILRAIAINPGPGAGQDRLFVSAEFSTHEYDSAANGSTLRDSEFAGSLDIRPRQSMGVDGTTGSVYFGANVRPIYVVDGAGKEILAEINGRGGPNGGIGSQPNLAVDQSNGHVLEFEPGQAVQEYDAAGAFIAEFGKSTQLTQPYRIAIDNACALHDPPLTAATQPTCEEFDPANGNVYVAYDDTAPQSFDVTAFGPLAYGEAPAAETGIAGDLGAGSATLNGTVNPSGFDLSGCEFEYLTDAQYQTNGKTFTGATSVPCAESLASIGKGNAPVAVHAAIGGLDPEGRYRFHLLAENKYGLGKGEARLFGPPVVTAKPPLPILYTEATLRANIDPAGLATEYHFEYGKGTGDYDQSTPVEELSANAAPTDLSAALTGLAEGTTYHFRIVAENDASVATGPDQTFLTLVRRPQQSCANTEYRTGLSANLPDCRAYELITPAETNGLSPVAIGSGTAGLLLNNWLVAPRGPGAGESLAYFIGGTLPGFDGNGRIDGYRAQRGAGAHPAGGWENTLFGPSFKQSGPGTLHFASQQGVSSDQLYSFWLMDPEEELGETFPKGSYLRTPAGFEPLGRGSLGIDLNAQSRFLSAGGTHAIFFSKAHLEEAAAPAGTEAIYDRAAGSEFAQVISLRPDGSPFGAGENAAYVAASEDGSAVVFDVGGSLYLHRGGQTVEIAEDPNVFAGLSEDGRRVFYAAGASGESPAALFACDVEAGPCAGAGAHAPTEIATGSIFVNVSADGSQAFFSSEAALTGAEENEAGEAAEAGQHNLYGWDGASTRFLAILDPQDFANNLKLWTTAIAAGAKTGRATSPTRATPGGEVFVFQSHTQLTAYDNEGIGEIYRHDPLAPAGERLLCVSCDPSEAPPGGDAMLQLAAFGSGTHVTTVIPNVTDDGQAVFFQSPDRLLPEDANDALDVYEWSARGAGDCERAGGCLALISSGQGEDDSFIYGMSADGHDVFFLTREKLVGADVPGSPSLYDARVEGGIPDLPAPAPCQGDSCQGNGAPPPALPSPATGGEGNGNAAKGGGTSCRRGKRKVKGRCVSSHKKRHKKQQRANHDRRPRR